MKPRHKPQRLLLIVTFTMGKAFGFSISASVGVLVSFVHSHTAEALGIACVQYKSDFSTSIDIFDHTIFDGTTLHDSYRTSTWAIVKARHQ